jgi:hypothetical protein
MPVLQLQLAQFLGGRSPGALIAGLLTTFPLHWLLYLAAHDGTILGFIELPPGVNLNLSIEYMLYPFVIAIVFVLVGFKIAPMYKFRTAITLSVLYTMFAIGAFLLGMKRGVEISFGVRNAGPFIGLLIGLYIAKKEENNRKMEIN